jgi:hypothetical protein
MKALVSESLICALALGMTFVASLNAQTPSADTARYGPYPTYYKEIIMQWLNTQLIDPDSARIEWSENQNHPIGQGQRSCVRLSR